jgi:hypothetical protein
MMVCAHLQCARIYMYKMPRGLVLMIGRGAWAGAAGGGRPRPGRRGAAWQRAIRCCCRAGCPKARRGRW